MAEHKIALNWAKGDVPFTYDVYPRNHQITFKGFADQPDSYSVSLYSEPPTQRSKDLEKALLDFTEKTLGCKNSKIAHVENPAGAKDLYDNSFSMTEGWFQEAAGIQPKAATTAAAPAAATQ